MNPMLEGSQIVVATIKLCTFYCGLPRNPIINEKIHWEKGNAAGKILQICNILVRERVTLCPISRILNEGVSNSIWDGS